MAGLEAMESAGVLQGILWDLEAALIKRALVVTNWNQSEAARILGCNRTTFMSKAQNAGVSRAMTALPDRGLNPVLKTIAELWNTMHDVELRRENAKLRKEKMEIEAKELLIDAGN